MIVIDNSTNDDTTKVDNKQSPGHNQRFQDLTPRLTSAAATAARCASKPCGHQEFQHKTVADLVQT